MTRVECLDLVGWQADWATCRNCHGAPPAALEALIVHASADGGDLATCLALAHCCDCLTQHCPCGGYVALADLQALVDAPGYVASTPPSGQDWCDALVLAEAGHAACCLAAHPPVQPAGR